MIGGHYHYPCVRLRLYEHKSNNISSFGFIRRYPSFCIFSLDKNRFVLFALVWGFTIWNFGIISFEFMFWVKYLIHSSNVSP